MPLSGRGGTTLPPPARGVLAALVASLAIALPAGPLAAQMVAPDAVGLCFEGSANPELDVQYCGIAIESGELSGRSLATLYAQRGRAYIEIARADQAKLDFERALALNPLSADAYHGRGLAHHAAGDFAAAIRDFDVALELSPSFVEALRSRATARLYQGDLAAAIRDFDAELRRVPLDDVGRILRGLAYYASGQHVQAVEDLAAATAEGYPYRFLPLWLFLAQARSGIDGGAGLAAARNELEPRKWPAPLFDHYLGDADAASVIAALAALPPSVQQTRRGEAHLFIGESARLAGDATAARQHLTAAMAAADRRSVEWAMTKALLAQIER